MGWRYEHTESSKKKSTGKDAGTFAGHDTGDTCLADGGSPGGRGNQPGAEKFHQWRYAFRGGYRGIGQYMENGKARANL